MKLRTLFTAAALTALFAAAPVVAHAASLELGLASCMA